MHSDTYPITRRVSIISGAVNLLLAIGKFSSVRIFAFFKSDTLSDASKGP